MTGTAVQEKVEEVTSVEQQEQHREAPLDKTWLGLGKAFNLNVRQLKKIKAGGDIEAVLEEEPVTDAKELKQMEAELKEVELDAEARVQGQEIKKAHSDSVAHQLKVYKDQKKREAAAEKSRQRENPRLYEELPDDKGLGLDD